MLLTTIYRDVNITIADIFLSPIYLIIILFIAYSIKRKHIADNPQYRYLVPGLLIKILGAVVFSLIYYYYYNGGDTIQYFRGARAMAGLMVKNFSGYLSIIGGNTSTQNLMLFDRNTGWPPYYMWQNPNTFMVIKLVSPIAFICFRSFIATSIVLASLAYVGVWRLYLFFTNFYKNIDKQLAIAVFFVPSVIFWGSGIMKDTFTFASMCWFVYSVFKIVQKRQNIFINLIAIIINIYIIISIKPYIFLALFPGALLWVFFQKIKNIKNTIIRTLSFPIIIIGIFIMILFILSNFGDMFGKYSSIEGMVKQAQVVREDLTREEQYGSNYYELGDFENSITGILSVSHKAVIAGLYRPFIWEAKTPIVFLSAFENTILLLLTLYLIFKVGVFRFFRLIFSEPILMFSILYTVFFLFGVGLATANFGALVRYKIPAIPFYVAALFIISEIHKNKKLAKEKAEIQENEATRNE